jgi:predicted P-loop ATPase
MTTYRPPWGRVTEKRKRGFVYVLTANDIAFLRSDQDGLRRIWPMDVADVIDIEWISKNREATASPKRWRSTMPANNGGGTKARSRMS